MPRRSTSRQHYKVLRFFGDKVRTLRENAGMSQRDLADLAGIAQPDIPKIERGDRDLRLTSAERIACAFNRTLRDLLPPRKR